MKRFIVTATLVCMHRALSQTDTAVHVSHPTWLINNSPYFQNVNNNGILIDFRKDAASITKFEEMSQYFLDRTDGFTDGEVVDAMEHYFWGMKGGLAMELGALDGSPKTRSMTCEYEKTLNWKRILIEGNPFYRTTLKANSPLSFSVNAAICATPSIVHYSPKEYVGGIVEFMGLDFMKQYHPDVYNACVPPGNLASLNYSAISDLVKPVECIPMSHVLHKAKAKHVNYFILDVEGGEFEVLKSINWAHVKFDVMCIETEITNRPPGYADAITAYLGERGYVNATAQQGRNTWYIAKDFVPSSRPGLDPHCYNGARKSEEVDKAYTEKRKSKFSRCPM